MKSGIKTTKELFGKYYFKKKKSGRAKWATKEEIKNLEKFVRDI